MATVSHRLVSVPLRGSTIRRFDPEYWVTDFPRPMMASITNPAADSIRFDGVFYTKNDLAGLIWESSDRWAHNLTGYATNRDYRNCRLKFRWQSNGILDLDQVNGPIMVIEGRDESGTPQSWYVRMWNYATGTPNNAQIEINFTEVRAGLDFDDEIWAGDVDRIFISLTVPGYDGTSGMLPSPVAGGVTVSEIQCLGPSEAVIIKAGKTTQPVHGLSMCTAYDDMYHLTPKRVVNVTKSLGYSGDINHYVGMSHYFRLDSSLLATSTGGAINNPCKVWHEDFAAKAKSAGFEVIFSLSYELYDENCPEAWKQRDWDGDPAHTGWSPPSTFLSPANSTAMAYLTNVALAFCEILDGADLPVKFQLGEPWYWTGLGEYKPYIYDDASKAALGGSPVNIPDLRDTLTTTQKNLLDAAGVLLSNSTNALFDEVKDEYPSAITHLLAFLPSIVDEEAPELIRMNMPVGWAKPAFDILQIEDYDWVTAGEGDKTAPAIDAVITRLGYALEEQHYLSGFVLNPVDASAQWKLITKAADEAVQRGTPTFIWALPQVVRDSYRAYLWYPATPGEVPEYGMLESKLAQFRGAAGINAFWPLGGPQVILEGGLPRPRPQPQTFLMADGPPGRHFRPEVIQWVKDAGFDHIRVQYEPMTIMWAIENDDPEFLEWLLDYFDHCVEEIIHGGLGVVLSGILAGYADVMLLETVFAGMSAPRYLIYKEHLVALARKFKKYDPRRFCIELLNEPPGNGSTVVRPEPNWDVMYTGNWATDYQPDLYALMREEMPNHTIICTSDGWSNWQTLTQLEPSTEMAEDHNIIWTYHPLFPTPVSLSGYVYNQYFYIQRLHYPPGNNGQLLSEAIAHMEALVDARPEVATGGNPTATKAGLNYDLHQYFENPQDINWIRYRVNACTAWARSKGIPPGNVYASEWGATRDSTGFPGNILGTPLGSKANTRLDRIYLHRDMAQAFYEAGQRHAVDHLDTLNYGITLEQNNKIGPFDPLLIRELRLWRRRLFQE